MGNDLVLMDGACNLCYVMVHSGKTKNIVKQKYGTLKKLNVRQ